jgi:hypothetical protein
MRARNVSIGSMFAWIPATFRLVRNNIGAMMLASLIMLLGVMVLMSPLFYFEFKMFSSLSAGGMRSPGEMTGFWIAYVLCIGASLVLVPPMIAGWFRICADADSGRAVSGSQVLGAYGDGGTWLRLIGLGLVLMLVYALVIGLLFLAFRGPFTELVAMQAAQQAALATGGQPPPPSPALLGQIFLIYMLALPTLLVLQFIYMVAFAEVSLRPTPVLAALGEATQGVLRNLLKLLLLMFCVGMIAMFAMFLVALVLGVIAAVLMLVSKVLGLIAIGLLYMAFALLLYPVMFAGNYYVWKDMLGGDEPDATGAVAA